MLQAFQVLAFFFLQGEQPISPLCPATAPQFLDMCSVRLEVIEQNIMGMITFFPTIIQQAAEKTRKLRVRLRHKELGDEPVLAIETFIVAVPEEQQLLTEEGATPDPTEAPTPDPKKSPPPPPPPEDGQ